MTIDEFLQSHQWQLTVNLLSLVPAIAKGIPEAVALYEKTVAALKNGVTAEELQSLITERDALIDSILSA